MASGSLCYRLVTLGGLYRTDHLKDRVNWLIVILFKFLLPAIFVLLSERSDAVAFKWKMETYYMEHMQGKCLAYKQVPNIDFTSIQTFNPVYYNYDNVNESEELAQPSLTPEQLEKQLREILIMTKKHHKYLKRGNQMKSQVSEACCQSFKKLLDGRMLCWEEEASHVSAASFAIAMFLPFFATLLLAIIMLPIKNSKFIQKKIAGSGDRPGMEVTAEETTRNIQDSIQFVVELIAFYCVVFKVWQLTGAVHKCAKYTPCLPRYKSYQVVFLMAVAQTPWMCILWGLIYT